MSEAREYRPIACGLHDRLEALATTGVVVRIVARNPDGARRTIEDRLVDVFARGGEEFIRTGRGELIRLDRLELVDGVAFGRPEEAERAVQQLPEMKPEVVAMEQEAELESLRYPIGRFRARTSLSGAERRALIDDIAALPADLRGAVSDLSTRQLDIPYRPGGWTVRQVVHHLPDSHVNAYVRFKLAVTEDEPRIKAYDEAAWAELADGRGEDIEASLALLEALHRRWAAFLRSLEPETWGRGFRHPELGVVTLEANLQLYAWHGRHHLAHVTGLRERMAW